MTNSLFTPETVAAITRRRSAITVILPCMPETTGGMEREIYMSFIRALRDAPTRRMEVRILTAIHRAADATDNSDAYVSRVLVDMGLMAPRLAFPGDFLDHIDASTIRQMPLRALPPSYIALTGHWKAIGEDMPLAAHAPAHAGNDGIPGFLTLV